MKIKKIYNALKFITKHPLTNRNKIKTLKKYFYWQIRSRINPRPIVYPWIENTKLIIYRNMGDAKFNFYTGLHEFQGMSLLLHFLKNDDLFIDIGANIGSYTVLASGVKKAKTIAFEPIPQTYKYFLDNIALNQLSDRVKAFNIGIGSEQKIVKFTYEYDTTNHVITESDKVGYIEIRIERLDNILSGLYPVMLKIDVEGYEGEVLKGARKTLNKDSLKIIIIETNNTANRYGYRPEQIEQCLKTYGFKKCFYDPIKKEFVNHLLYQEGNTIYIRDHNFIVNKIITNPLISVLGKTY